MYRVWGFSLSMAPPKIKFLMEGKRGEAPFFPWILRCTPKKPDRCEGQFSFFSGQHCLTKPLGILRFFRSLPFYGFSSSYLSNSIPATPLRLFLTYTMFSICSSSTLLAGSWHHSQLSSSLLQSWRSLCKSTFPLFLPTDSTRLS